jgi:hypothetical protein
MPHFARSSRRTASVASCSQQDGPSDRLRGREQVAARPRPAVVHRRSGGRGCRREGRGRLPRASLLVAPIAGAITPTTHRKPDQPPGGEAETPLSGREAWPRIRPPTVNMSSRAWFRMPGCTSWLSPGNNSCPVIELPGRTVSTDGRELDDRVGTLLRRLRSAVSVEIGVGIARVGCVDPDCG